MTAERKLVEGAWWRGCCVLCKVLEGPRLEDEVYEEPQATRRLLICGGLSISVLKGLPASVVRT